MKKCKKRVNALIEEEMNRGSQNGNTDFKDSNLPKTISLFENNELLKEEYNRSGHGIKLDSLDSARYHLQAPDDIDEKNDSEIESTWLKASDNSKAQLEHMENSLMNQELMEKYSVNAWRFHVYKLENLEKRHRETLESTKQKTLELHRQRKTEQLAIGQKLTNHQEEWKRLINSTLQVDLAVQSLEAEILLLQQQASHKDESQTVNSTSKLFINILSSVTN